jgi:hypothetical protein
MQGNFENAYMMKQIKHRINNFRGIIKSMLDNKWRKIIICKGLMMCCKSFIKITAAGIAAINILGVYIYYIMIAETIITAIMGTVILIILFIVRVKKLKKNRLR